MQIGMKIGIPWLEQLLSRAGLNINFTTGRLDPRITFSRTSNATITKSDGTIGYAPHNLLTYSEQFDNAAWGKQRATITANIIAAPNGTFTADVLTEDLTATETHQIARTITTDATAYTYSIYVKANTRNWVALWANSAGAYFNVSTGTVGTVSSGVTANITNEGNGWYRCSVTRVMTAASNSFIVYMATANNTAIYTGDGTSNIYLWGAQLEVGASPTSYNPTTVKNLLGYTEAFDNAAWTKSNSFVQTNLLTYSEAFDNAVWAKVSATVSANVTTAPNGYQTADLFIPNSAAQGYITSAATVIATATTATASIYFKPFGLDQFTYWYGGAGANRVGVTVNTTNNTITNYITGTGTNPSSSSITDVGNGWYRLVFTFVTTAANDVMGVRYLSNTTNNGTNGVYIWGAQLVQGSVAGDYRRTDAAALPVFYPNHNGVVCAEKLVENTATNSHFTNQTTTVVSGTKYTYSVYAKAGERNWFSIFAINTVNADNTYFNLSTGVIGNTQSGATASMTAVGNGWYRCSVTATTNNTTSGIYPGIASANGTSSYAGDGTSGIYIFGAQLSDSASLDPYVLNATAAPSAQAYYGSRFDYDPVTLAPKGLLIEEQRINLALQSADFSTTWSLNNILAFGSGSVANAATSPDGTQNADKIVPSAVGGAHFVSQTTTVTNGASYTTTVYAKPAGYTWILLWSNTASTGAYFDVQNGTIGTVSAGVTASITSVGNGWYRCSITKTTASVAEVIAIMAATGNNGFNFTGDGTSGVYLWGAQLEAGAFATSYIPTAASSVTRAADVAVIQGSNFYSWYNQNEGTFFANFLTSYSGNADLARYIISLDNSTSKRVMYTSAGGDTLNNFDGSTVIFASTDITGIQTKAATSYTPSNRYITANNIAVASGAVVGTYSYSSSLSIGQPLQLCGWIKQISYYNTRLPNATLQGLTA